MDIGDRIKHLLSEKGMTVKGLSELSGVPANTIYALTKKGGAKNARKKTLQKIADALGVSVSHLIGADEIIKASNDILANFDPATTKPLTREEFYKLTQKDRRTDTINKYDQLNNVGQHKANEYITDLYENDKYTTDE